MADADVEFRCFVGGLALVTTDESLGDVFSQYGKIIDSKIINDPETGSSMGFGFVTFKDEHSLRDAIEEMDGHDLDGHCVTVKEAQSCGHALDGHCMTGNEAQSCGSGGRGDGYGGCREGGGGGYGGGGGGDSYSRGGGASDGKLEELKC